MDKVPSFLTEALRFRDPHPEILRNVPDRQWRAVLSSWRVVRLTLPLGLTCRDYLPHWVREKIDLHLANNSQRFERIKQAYGQAAAAFRASGVEHVVVKGFSLSPGYADHPRFRAQSDIDVYCPPESAARARDALAGIGYLPSRVNDHLPQDHLPPMVPAAPWEWRGNFFDPQIPVGFEIHFRFWDNTLTRIDAPGLDKFWDRRIERQLDDITFAGLAPADNLAYAALNLLRDLLHGWMAAEQVYGLARFLHTTAGDHEFWQTWRSSQSDEARQLQSLAFLAALNSFDCRLANEVQDEIQQLPPNVLQWFRYYAQSLLTGPASSRRKDSVWLHLQLLRSTGDKAYVFFQRLAPLPARLPAIASVVAEATEPVNHHQNLPSKVQSLAGRSVRYLGWYFQRLTAHTTALIPTLTRGCGYWFSTRNLSRQFWTFLAGTFCFDLGMTMFFFLYNLFLLDRGYREDFLGYLMGAMSVGSLICTIPAGALVQRLGPRTSMMLCIVLVSSVSVARTLFAARSALLVLSFLAGLVTTIWAVAISPAIARLTDERSRPYGFSIIFSSGIGVGVVANLLGSRVPAWFMTLRPALPASQAKQAALLAACAIVACGLLPLSRVRFAPASTDPTKRKLYPRSPFVLKFLFGIGIWSVVTGSLSPLSNVYFSQYLRMPLERMGVVFSFSNLCQVLGVLAAPFLFRRIGLISGIAATQLATAALLILLASTTHAIPAAVIYVGYSGFLWMSQPGLLTLLMDRVHPSEQAGASALNFFVASLVQALAVSATGASFSRFGYPAVLTASAGVAIIAAIVLWLLLGRPSLPSTKTLTAVAEVQGEPANPC